MTTPDLASIIDEQEAEIGRLVAELAVVRRDWKADVGTLTARALTAEARAARLNTEIAYLLEDNEQMGQRDMQRAAAARKVARAYRELDAENSRWIGIVSGVLHERDAARAEAARYGVLEALQPCGHKTRYHFFDRDGWSVCGICEWERTAALRGPAQSEQP